uniref:Uncharacterized protein n=1 Tax=Knipowitschia caucasica TaxID=637954 RepID=A0AAV2MD83_KNICA
MLWNEHELVPSEALLQPPQLRGVPPWPLIRRSPEEEAADARRGASTMGLYGAAWGPEPIVESPPGASNVVWCCSQGLMESPHGLDPGGKVYPGAKTWLIKPTLGPKTWWWSLFRT